MRFYCTSPDNCSCEGVEGTLTELEARLEILKERKHTNPTSVSVLQGFVLTAIESNEWSNGPTALSYRAGRMTR